MFEKFTERARKVMSLSRQEAQRLNQIAIGTEHILLGLVREGGGLAVRVLKNLNVDLARVVAEIEKLVKADSSFSAMLGQLPFTSRSKRVIELAGEAASQLGNEVIGTEHLLLGLLKENEGIAAQVLINLGVKLDEVRDMTLEILGQDVGAKQPAATPSDAEPHFGSSALSSHEKAEMIVSAWLARGGQETAPNHTDHLTKLIAWAIEASKRGA